MVDIEFFPDVNSVIELSKCRKNRIGIRAYNRNTTNANNVIRTSFSPTLSSKNCEQCTSSCEYVDVFGVTLIELATKITDISTTKLFITALDSEGNLTDPLIGNVSALKLMFHTGIISVHVMTKDGEKVYTRRVMRDMLSKI